MVVVAGAGVAFVLTGSDNGGDGPPDAEFRLNVTAESVAVVHESGEQVDSDKIQVTILAGGERTELGLSEFDKQPDDTEQFAQTGDTYTGNVTVSMSPVRAQSPRFRLQPRCTQCRDQRHQRGRPDGVVRCDS